jgi:ribosome maturation factor RimP
LEAEIEENGWLPQKYTLDVSSPGAEKPMKILRQFHKHVGRELKIKLKDGQEITGDLLKIDGQTLEISSTKADNIEIDFNDVQQASIIIKFK